MRYNNYNIEKNLYQTIHCWIRYHYGKANKCENKNCPKKSKNYQWALKRGKKYEKNIKSYKQLCVSCHRNYDMTEEIKRHIKEASYNAKITECPLGHPYSKENTVIVKKEGYRERDCRICHNRRKTEWREKNLTMAKKLDKQYHEENREKRNSYSKNYYVSHKEYWHQKYIKNRLIISPNKE